ncbi:MAG: TetR/AcrR family transcriptional regulator, partial [Lachnospiraceae bacterium]|nr:TetR/AcrR family transcriptional regulator [Candidatus Equihabitans merdae]
MDTRRKETDKKIKAAFIALMETKPPSKITAQELCSKADINRSTFYDHYPYMDALIRDIIHDQVMSVCMDEVTSKAYFQEPVSSIPHQVIRSYIHRFRSNR